MTRAPFISGFEDLEALRMRFEGFRSGHAKRRRLPEELWRAAAEIAARRGVNVVARSLRLDVNSLKQWMGVNPKSANDHVVPARKGIAPQFVEFLTQPAKTDACVLELESPQGNKLRLEWKGVTASDVTQLIRAFVGR